MALLVSTLHRPYLTPSWAKAYSRIRVLGLSGFVNWHTIDRGRGHAMVEVWWIECLSFCLIGCWESTLFFSRRFGTFGSIAIAAACLFSLWRWIKLKGRLVRKQKASKHLGAVAIRCWCLTYSKEGKKLCHGTEVKKASPIAFASADEGLNFWIGFKAFPCL